MKAALHSLFIFVGKALSDDTGSPSTTRIIVATHTHAQPDGTALVAALTALLGLKLWQSKVEAQP